MMGLKLLALGLVLGAANALSRPPSIFNQPSKDIFYKAGETVTMPCEAHGEPRPAYKWRRNEIDFNPAGNDVRIVILPNVGTLVINMPEDKDEGIYQCLAENDFGTSASVTVNLREARLGRFADEKPVYHKPQLGAPFTLPCVPPESVPPPQVFWVTKTKTGSMDVVNYDDRVTIDREYRLRFINIKEEDAMEGRPYACMAMNGIMRDNSQGRLHYIEPTGMAQYRATDYMWADQSDRFGLQGDDFNVKCIFSGNPTPDVHWERTDNKSMTERHKIMSFSQELEIQNLQPEDAGQYECWASNTAGAGRKIRTFLVRVQSRPYFLKEPENLELGVGENAAFECMASGNPKPQIKWYVNGVSYSTLQDERMKGRLKKESDTRLFLANVQQTDYMNIQCNASNIHGYVFADVYLNVLQEAPTIIAPPDKLKVTAEGVSSQLTCEVTGKPNPIITWFKNGEQITGGRYEIKPEGHLYISSVVLSDAGLYRCHAKNKFNETFAEGKLVVRRKTRIEQKPGDLEVNAGNSGKFTCSGTTDPEEVHNLKIVWYKDGKEITANDQRMTQNYQDNSLTISGTIVRDSGTYTCNATNDLDFALASAVLTIKDRPDPPSQVYHEWCNKNATVHWMPGSYNNAPIQYFILQYNTTFNPDKWHFGLKVNSTLTKINMTLSPWVTYTFRIIAYNKIGPSEPSFHSPEPCVTKEDRPAFNPRNLRTRGHQPGKLWIEWTPVPQLQQNAPGFYYQLQYQAIGDNAIDQLTTKTINDWEQDHIEIIASRVYQKYKITLKAGNNIGEAMNDASTIEGYSYEARPTLQPSMLQVLGSPTDTSATFTWEFPKREIGASNTKIRGQFRGFKIQFWEEGRQKETIREMDIEGEAAGYNQTGDTFTAVIGNMLPNKFMEAHISVRNNFYIGPASDPTKFRTDVGFPGPVPQFEAINVGDTHVNLRWNPPLDSRGDLIGYDISYRTVKGLDLGEMQEREPQINEPYTTESYLSGLKYQTRYRVYIYARTARGRGESYFIEVVTANPGKPRMPSFNIAGVGHNNINVTWWVDARAGSGTVVYVEYKKQNGPEWLRTTDEVVHTWKNIENLEPGTVYEMRLMTTNGKKTKASGIEVITTQGTALAYDLVGNIGWFLGMLFSALLLIALAVLFFLCHRRGYRLSDEPAKGPYAPPYSDTVGVAQDNDQFGPEPQGYNNDYYSRPEYEDDQGGFEKSRPPPSYNGHGHDSQDGRYQDYPVGGANYDGRDDGYNRQDDGYDRRDDYDRRDYDDRDYDRHDDYYNRDSQGYDRRSDYDDRRDYDYDGRDYEQPRDYDRQGYAPSAPSADGYDRRDDYDDRSDNRYDNSRDYDDRVRYEDSRARSGSRSDVASSTQV